MRHAFALAFDLALLRDPVHSILVPFLLRAPWIVAVALLSAPGADAPPSLVRTVWIAASVGGSITWWAVDAMLRFRARSVFNTPHGVPPAPVLECYESGFKRLPWLYLTEWVRNIALGFGASVFLLPGVFLGYKLAFSTEAVVLHERNLSGAVQRSFHLNRGRFERWLEFVAMSAIVVIATWFIGAAVSVMVGRFSTETWALVGLLLVVTIAPVVQYAWTFFYLRLVEVEEPQLQEVGPFYASGGLGGQWRAPGGSQPRLTLAEPRPSSPQNGRNDGARAGSEPG
jgi:hypothetical protein